ncbi:MAG: hypothetical protein K5985_05810 [Lachnospiraceae bacterium]|nr:hypothetical protein [Lachnospiraceae bacterium]
MNNKEGMTEMIINDKELENVSGGVREEADIPTKGKSIVCPVCEHGDRIKKKALYDPDLGSVQYECKCGAKFVYYGNSVIMYDDFKKKLEEKDYFDYKF